MTSQTGQQIIAIHILSNISSKGNQAIKFGQLIEYNMNVEGHVSVSSSDNVKNEWGVCVKIDLTEVPCFGNFWNEVGGLVCQLLLIFVWFIN